MPLSCKIPFNTSFALRCLLPLPFRFIVVPSLLSPLLLPLRSRNQVDLMNENLKLRSDDLGLHKVGFSLCLLEKGGSHRIKASRLVVSDSRKKTSKGRVSASNLKVSIGKRGFIRERTFQGVIIVEVSVNAVDLDRDRPKIPYKSSSIKGLPSKENVSVDCEKCVYEFGSTYLLFVLVQNFKN